MKSDIKTLGIHLKVSNFDKSRKFYDSLGFKSVFAYGPKDYLKSLPEGIDTAPEKYRGIEYKVGDTNIELAEDHVGIPKKEVFQEKIGSPKVSEMVKVGSLVPLFNNPLVNIKFPVHHYYWGTIEVALRDPDGFVLVFIAPHSEEEFKKVSEFTKIEVVNPA